MQDLQDLKFLTYMTNAEVGHDALGFEELAELERQAKAGCPDPRLVLRLILNGSEEDEGKHEIGYAEGYDKGLEDGREEAKDEIEAARELGEAQGLAKGEEERKEAYYDGFNDGHATAETEAKS